MRQNLGTPTLGSHTLIEVFGMESEIKKRVKKIFHEILVENTLEENQSELANPPIQKPSTANPLHSKPDRYRSKMP